MGADTKSLRTRIKSVRSTQHLTKAMGLVASSKIRRATDAMFKSRDYDGAVSAAVTVLAGSAECRKSPFLQPVTDGTIRLVVIAGDRGMAGGYNANVFRLVRDLFADNPAPIAVFPIGKRACDRYGQGIASAEAFSCDEAHALAHRLCDEFLAGEFTRLGIVRTDYHSVLTQTARLEWILPLSVPDEPAAGGVIFEPDERTILDAAVPAYVAGKLVAAVRESFACEVAARRTAMDSADKNAQQMIDDLQLAYNRARQGAITQEITEIVAGGAS